jgi:phosphoribosylformimino-5-aminoimidazole carboxamide ribotide isomerase
MASLILVMIFYFSLFFVSNFKEFLMTIYPAIDLRGGKCVRLFQGLADQQTTYFEDPSEPALKWQSDGATHLHLVDLDGAFSGSNENLNAVRSILKKVNLKVQLGGGMRNSESIEHALSLGLSRVIVGTRACSDPDWVKDLVEKFGADRIVVGIDARDGKVATKGWVETTNTLATDLAQQVQDLGIRWIIHTDVATDGAMQGPNFEAQQKMALAAPSCNIIASGGVTTEDDVFKLRDLSTEIPNLEGVIIGKALYEGSVQLKHLIS